MVMEMKEDDSDEGAELDEVGQEQLDNSSYGSPRLSLNVLTGTSNFQTMRVTGMHNKKPIQVLIDSGSTHNFRDLDAAKRHGVSLSLLVQCP